MKEKTPIFPGWQRYFGGRLRLPKTCPSPVCGQWESLLGAVFSADWFAPFERRHRVYNRRTTFWLTLGQIYGDGAEAQGSLRDAVRSVQASRERVSLPACSSSTSALAQAKGRMSLKLWKSAFARSREAVESLSPEVPGWEGRSIKLVDGTTVSLADTADNQSIWPQHANCSPGCGFPLAYLTALFSLGSGAVLDYAITNLHTGEQNAAYAELWPTIEAGDIVVGDRGFSSYALLARLQGKGADFLVRVKDQHRRRWKKQRLGPDQWEVRIPRPQCRNELHRDDWDTFPKAMRLRLIRVPGRNREGEREALWLLTTLPESPERLDALYRARWRIEIGFRDLKRTLGMFHLRTKSSEAVEKEIHAFMLAYNLLRYLHVHCVHSGAKTPLMRLSLKGAMDALRRFHAQAPSLPFYASRARDHFAALISVIADDPNPHRPDRWEPRRRKNRHRGAPWMTVSRKVLQTQYKANVINA